MASYPQARQTFIRPGHVRRSATCPDHNRQSSEFRGLQENMIDHKVYWAFKCTSKGGHIFLALPDRTAPQDAEGAAVWQKQAEADKVGLSH